MIQLHDFSIGYPQQPLISEANATIGRATLTALIGRNGSGKSTLLRAIAGLNTHYSGRIMLDGKDIASLAAPMMARLVAFVSTKSVRVPNLRCEDLVAMGRAPYTNWIGRMQPADKEIVGSSLRLVGMADYASRTLDTMSDGECQRIMIARALAQDTPIVLLDEPTSFLDLPNRYELCNLLSSLAHHEDKTILFSTHELYIALKMTDSIALVHDHTLEVAPTADLRTTGRINSIFGLDQ